MAVSASVARPEIMFYGDDHQYMCCWCHCCHSKTACLIVAIIGFAFALLALISGGLGYDASGAQFWINIVTQVLVIVVYAALLYACYTENPSFVLPALVFQALIVVVYILGGIALIIALIFGGSDLTKKFIHLPKNQIVTDEEVSAIAVSSIVPLLVQILIGLGILVLIWRFYRYCRDKKVFMENYKFRAVPGEYPGSERNQQQKQQQQQQPASVPSYYYQQA